MAVDGSLIFNTKIDTSGLNSDIARINKAIEAAQKKAQSGARQTAQTAKGQADKSSQAAENSAKREITATQEKLNRLKTRQSKPHRQRKRYQNQSSNLPKRLLIRLRAQLIATQRQSAKHK